MHHFGETVYKDDMTTILEAPASLATRGGLHRRSEIAPAWQTLPFQTISAES